MSDQLHADVRELVTQTALSNQRIESMAESMERRDKLLFGVRGDNGVVGRVAALEQTQGLFKRAVLLVYTAVVGLAVKMLWIK